jgi:hypothetical protein
MKMLDIPICFGIGLHAMLEHAKLIQAREIFGLSDLRQIVWAMINQETFLIEMFWDNLNLDL